MAGTKHAKLMLDFTKNQCVEPEFSSNMLMPIIKPGPEQISLRPGYEPLSKLDIDFLHRCNLCVCCGEFSYKHFTIAAMDMFMHTFIKLKEYNVSVLIEGLNSTFFFSLQIAD